MSAPMAPGSFSRHRASGSAMTIPSAFAACSACICSVKSRSTPLVPGYWKIAPKTVEASRSEGRPVMISIPRGFARVRITAMFCGCSASSTKKAVAFDLDDRCAMVIASAAAVASSRSEALAIGRPVRSAIIVW
jgi:hypothetical protein